jgi:hypothetical protein
MNEKWKMILFNEYKKRENKKGSLVERLGENKNGFFARKHNHGYKHQNALRKRFTLGDYTGEGYCNCIKFINLFTMSIPGAVKRATNITKRMNIIINSRLRIFLYFLFIIQRRIPPITNAIRCGK